MIEAQYSAFLTGPWNPLAVDRTSPPTWTDNDPGGYGEAHVHTLNIPNTVRDNLQGRYLRLLGPTGPVFFGRIESKPLPDGEVMAYGQQTWMDDLVANAGLVGGVYNHDLGGGVKTYAPRYEQVTYCETDLSGLQNVNSMDWQMTVTDGGVQFVLPAGSLIPANIGEMPNITAVLPIGACASGRVQFDIAVVNGNPIVTGAATNFGIFVTVSTVRRYYRVQGLIDYWDFNRSDPGWQLNSGVCYFGQDGGGTGQYHVISETYPIDGISIVVINGSSTGNNGYGTLAAPITVTLSNFRVYGTATSATGSTAAAVIGDVVSRLPAAALTQNTSFLTADSTDLGRIVSEATTKFSDTIATVLGVVDARYGWWCRLVGGDWPCLPVYEPHSTTPDYEAWEDLGADQDSGGVTATLTPGGINDMCSMTRVSYKSTAGGASDNLGTSSYYVDVPDTDPTHLLVQQGIVRVRSTVVSTDIDETAKQCGRTSNSYYGRSNMPGTVKITRPIHATSGGMVMPCDLEPGKLLLLHSARYGDVTATMVSINHTGVSQADVTLDSDPFSPKKLKRALRKGSVGAGGQVAGLA